MKNSCEFAFTSRNLWHGRAPEFHSNLRQWVHLGLVCDSRTPRTPIPNTLCLFTLPNQRVSPGLGYFWLCFLLLRTVSFFPSAVLRLPASLYLSPSHLLIVMPSISSISINEQGASLDYVKSMYMCECVCNMSNPWLRVWFTCSCVKHPSPLARCSALNAAQACIISRLVFIQEGEDVQVCLQVDSLYCIWMLYRPLFGHMNGPLIANAASCGGKKA